MTDDHDHDQSRRCAMVQRMLPAHVDGRLSAPSRKLVEHHVAGCTRCADELDGQRLVDADLEDLAEVLDSASSGVEVPEDLLDVLLAQSRGEDLRARVAGPVRGAISGQRPALTFSLALALLAIVGAAGWAGWRLGGLLQRNRD